MGPKFYAPFLKKFGSEVTILTNRAITLQDGALAYRTDIRWTVPAVGTWTSIFVTAFQEGKWVAVVVRPSQDVSTYAPIPESLTFK